LRRQALACDGGRRPDRTTTASPAAVHKINSKDPTKEMMEDECALDTKKHGSQRDTVKANEAEANTKI
jgi:hypothetical protein